MIYAYFGGRIREIKLITKKTTQFYVALDDATTVRR